MRGVYLMAGAGLLCACLAGWAALAWAQSTPGAVPATDSPPATAATAAPSATKADKATPGSATGDAPVSVPPPPSTLLPDGAPPAAATPPAAMPAVGAPAMIPSSVPVEATPPAGKASSPPAAMTPARSAFTPDGEAAAMSEGAIGRQEPAISLEWIGPPTAKVGQAGDYTLAVRNVSNMPVQGVVVSVYLPTGLKVGTTEPRHTVENNLMKWELGALLAKQERNIQLKMTAENKGDLVPKAWVRFTGATMMRIKAREPKIALKILTPEKPPLVGDPAQFTLAISNPGDGSADQVKIQAVLSEGLEHARGNRINFEIGNLAAGETRNVALLCGTRTGGAQKCEATAEAEGGLKASDSATVNVIVPRLDLRVSGPGLRYLERKALYTLKVTNPGDAPATNVTVADTVPAGFKVLAASDGGRHDFQTRTVSWFLGEVGPGQTREVKLEVQAINAGEHKHKATAVGARGLRAESETTTRVEGVSALLVELIDTEDPIEVNGETAYEVRITNTGSKTETDIKLVATVPDKMEFKGVEGAYRYREEGKTIIFEPIKELQPRADALLRIKVRTLEPGTVRFRITVSSTNLTEPVTKEEPTRIYADAPEPGNPAAPAGPATPPAGTPAVPSAGPAPGSGGAAPAP